MKGPCPCFWGLLRLAFCWFDVFGLIIFTVWVKRVCVKVMVRDMVHNLLFMRYLRFGLALCPFDLFCNILIRVWVGEKVKYMGDVDGKWDRK